MGKVRNSITSVSVRSSQTIVGTPKVDTFLGWTPMAKDIIEVECNKLMPPNRANQTIPFESVALVMFALCIARTTDNEQLRRGIINAMRGYAVPQFIIESAKVFTFEGLYDKGRVFHRVKFTNRDETEFQNTVVAGGLIQAALNDIFIYCRSNGIMTHSLMDVSDIIADSAAVQVKGYISSAKDNNVDPDVNQAIENPENCHYWLGSSFVTPNTAKPGWRTISTTVKTVDIVATDSTVLMPVFSRNTANNGTSINFASIEYDWTNAQFYSTSASLGFKADDFQLLMFGPFISKSQEFNCNILLKVFHVMSLIVRSELLLWSQQYIDKNIIVDYFEDSEPRFEPARVISPARITIDSGHPAPEVSREQRKDKSRGSTRTQAIGNYPIGRKGQNFVTYNFLNNKLKKLGLSQTSRSRLGKL